MSEDEEDFLEDLEADLEFSKVETLDEHEQDEIRELQLYAENYQPVSLSNYKKLDPRSLTQLPLLENKICLMLSNGNNDIAAILSVLNSLSFIAQTDTLVLHNFMKLLYREKFNELETLIPSPLQYAAVICTIETGQGQLREDVGLTKEQQMVFNMAMKTSFQDGFVVDKSKLLQARDLLVNVSKIQSEINSFILSEVKTIAPNVCALVGAQVGSLLISHAGGILELSQIPSCNLASIGKNKHLSHELHTNLSGVRQEGHIYHCTLVQEQPMEIRKQMVRMICAKVALAARVDAGKAKDDNLGACWREQLLQKVQKMQEPPDITKTKPLPIPEEKPKKKRAGRKFRKYKQQFQLSRLRQLQNRMEFGKAEKSMLDGTGEEIGMGMARSLQGVPMATNNGAKMTKSMKRRVGEANEQAKAYMLSLDEGKSIPTEKENEEKISAARRSWYKHHMDG
ncbi:related to Pre-mRNA-processing factor 31 [Zygosaccharomyces bailii]|nr:related to Pre-mRNA-processing factor 31 [Zygosaccharomyces bailii]